MNIARRTVTVDLRETILWGLTGSTWMLACDKLSTIKPYDGEELALRMEMNSDQFHSFKSWVAFELHHIDPRIRPDRYDLDTRIATFTKAEVVDSAKLGMDGPVFDMTVILSRQNISYLKKI